MAETTYITLSGVPILPEGKETVQTFIMRPYIFGAGVATAFSFAASMVFGQHPGISLLMTAVAWGAAKHVHSQNKKREKELTRRNSIEEERPVRRFIDMAPAPSEKNHKDWGRVAQVEIKRASDAFGTAVVGCGALSFLTYTVGGSWTDMALNGAVAVAPVFFDSLAKAYRWGKVQEDRWIVRTEAPLSEAETKRLAQRKALLCLPRGARPDLVA